MFTTYSNWRQPAGQTTGQTPLHLDAKKAELVEKFCRWAIADMSLPDDADSRWRWMGPMLATGYWGVPDLLDIFPSAGMKDYRHIERQARWAAKRVNVDDGPDWLLSFLKKEGYSLQEYLRREYAKRDQAD